MMCSLGDCHAGRNYSARMNEDTAEQNARYQNRISEDHTAFEFRPQMCLTTKTAQALFFMLLMAFVVPTNTTPATASKEEPLPAEDQGSFALTSCQGVDPSNAAAKIFTPIKSILFNINVAIQNGSYPQADQIPLLTAAESGALYRDDLKPNNGGGANWIFKATSKYPRPNIPSGEPIAIRCHPTSPTAWIDPQLHAYGYLSAMATVSPYIPQMSGLWKGPSSGGFATAGLENKMLFCMEMPFINGTSLEYPYPEKTIGPRALFEYYLGNWALERVAKIFIGDNKGRHHLVTKDPKSVVYTIFGTRYAFGPGYSPRRIDYDNFGKVNSQDPKEPYFVNCGGEWQKELYETKAALPAFVKDVCTMGLFAAIKIHFSAYEVSEENPAPSPHETNYYATPILA